MNARPISIRQPYLTIAGQTAPGDGITIRGGDLRIMTHNIIVRYLHYRGGSSSFVKIRPWRDAHDIIIDHCSASAGTDDIFDVHWSDGNTFPGDDPAIRRVTFQNCIIAEAHKKHPTGMIFGSGADLTTDPPRVGSEQVHHLSAHNNYFVHNGWRNPLVKSGYSEVINNVVYNWGNRIGGVGSGAEVDWLNNYYRKGPMSGSRPLVLQWLDGACRPYPLNSIYIAGNIMPSKGLTDPSADNWFLFITNQRNCGDYNNPVPTKHRRFIPLSPAPVPVTIQPSSLSMVDSILADVGANRRLNADGSFTNIRDSADKKFVDDFYAGTGPSSPPSSFTIPTVNSGTPYADTDHDGMADDWESIHGFNPNIKDGNGDADGDGYTNLEEFLNGTIP